MRKADLFVQEVVTVIDRGIKKRAKHCVVCGKLFTERKKWRNFEEVKYCSKRCKSQ